MEVAVSHSTVINSDPKEWEKIIEADEHFCIRSEEEDPDEYPFPLTLRTKKSSNPGSPIDSTPLPVNGNSTVS